MSKGASDLYNTMCMKVSRPNLTADQVKALPVTILAMKGDKDMLRFLGLYDPDGMIIQQDDVETDLLESLKRFNERYRKDPDDANDAAR
jgi:hypothetical protein